MNPITLTQLKDSWFTKQNDLMQKRRPRRYLHFDRPIPVLDKKTWAKITSADFITKHSFSPLLNISQSNRVYKKKPTQKFKVIEWKPRPISYPSHLDALIYSWYAYQLEFFYEQRVHTANLNGSVIAYRKLGKSNVDFALEIFDFIKNNPDCSTLCLDVKGFYDNLDCKQVKKSWKENLALTDLPDDHYAVYKSISKYSYTRLREVKKLLKIKPENDKKHVFNLDTEILNQLRTDNKIKKSKLGIPQGTPISCVLSNLYMFDFDKALLEKVTAVGGLYRRYSDDILIVCPTASLKTLELFACEKIEELKLKIQKEKTEIRNFYILDGDIICTDENSKSAKFQYLGIVFDGKDITLRHKGYAKFERKMKNAIVRQLIKAKENKTPIFKKKIYEKYSPFGKNNYIAYANSAGKKLSSIVIGKQVAFQKIMRKINNKLHREKK
jgi:RNA-directed DNA polymerase